jgi:hypothetical protein
MVQTTVRPVFTVFRTARITMAAARASSPASVYMMVNAMSYVIHLHTSLLPQVWNCTSMRLPTAV